MSVFCDGDWLVYRDLAIQSQGARTDFGEVYGSLGNITHSDLLHFILKYEALLLRWLHVLEKLSLLVS